MILIGRPGSPFVRRVASTLNHYGMKYESLPLSTATQAADIAKFNPLIRVPSLVLDDGEALIDSNCIIDFLDELAGPERALTPRSGPERRQVLRLVAIATGVAEFGVQAYYERDRRPADKVWPDWVAKRSEQVEQGLQTLEALAPAPWLALGRMTQADVTAAIVLEFIQRVLPTVAPAGRFPGLEALVTRLGAEPFYAEARDKG